MDVSETIVAAVIGAAATVSAAMFQISRARAYAESRQKRSTLRGTMLTLTLMLAAAASGFIFAELRAADVRASARAEIVLLRSDLKAQLASLESATARIASSAQAPAQKAVVSDTETATREALIQLPACVASTDDSAGPAPVCAAAPEATLCAILPSGAEPLGVEWFSRSAENSAAWQAHRGAASVSTRGVRFEAADVVPAAGDGAESPTCARVANHDPAHGQLARVTVQYRVAPELPAATAVAAR